MKLTLAKLLARKYQEVLCFMSLLYLDLYVLRDDALMLGGLSCKPNIYVS